MPKYGEVGDYDASNPPYRPWKPPERDPIDSYGGEDDEMDESMGLVVDEVVSSRIVALAALITAMNGVELMRGKVVQLCEEAMKIAVPEKPEKRSVDETVDGAE